MVVHMNTLYLIRHAESTANAQHLLAGRKNFPLTATGKTDAAQLAQDFARQFRVDSIWCSPLLRAQQTAAPFISACDIGLSFDNRLLEQDMGRFSGMSYTEAESDRAYCADRNARWDWQPEGGGESYRQIAERVGNWLDDLRRICAESDNRHILVVTHAVTMRLFRACLEGTLPRYPEKIAGNGELWIAPLSPDASPVIVESRPLANGPRLHRA